MVRFFSVLIFSFILFSCAVKDRFFIGEFKNENIKLQVHSQMSNKLESWLDLNTSYKVYHSYDSVVLFDQNSNLIQIDNDPNSETKDLFNVSNANQLYDQNKVIYLVFYKSNLRIGKAMLIRDNHYRYKSFSGH